MQRHLARSVSSRVNLHASWYLPCLGVAVGSSLQVADGDVGGGGYGFVDDVEGKYEAHLIACVGKCNLCGVGCYRKHSDVWVLCVFDCANDADFPLAFICLSKAMPQMTDCSFAQDHAD